MALPLFTYSQERGCAAQCAGMGVYEFVATMTGHLAWPVVVVVVLLLFRRSISRRIEHLRTVSAGSFAAEFGETEQKVNEALAAEEAAHPPPNAVTERDKSVAGEEAPTDNLVTNFLSESVHSEFQRIGLLAYENPSYAVVASWSLLELVMSNTLEGMWKDVGRAFPRNSVNVVQELGRLKIITSETLDATDGLRRLRNDVAHGALNPEVGAATAYVQSAERLAATINLGALRQQTAMSVMGNIR